MYEEGKGVKQDDLKALKFFQKACDLKSSCLTPLPFSYESPRLEQPPPEFKSQYEKGKGVKQDDLKALKFFQKACDLNYG
jgi:TPR repeat protein